MNRSSELGELGKALSKAQGQISIAKEDSDNPFFKSKYADLASVWEACRKPLSENGLSVIQCISVRDSKRLLETTLLHSSGQYIVSELDLTPKDNTPQAIGSAITYAKRYALAAIVGVCSAIEDDDAEAAMGREPRTNNKQSVSKTNEEPYGEQITETLAKERVEAEHWCSAHKTKFFKSGKMKSYAHPIKDEFDENGKQVWCHEPSEQPKADNSPGFNPDSVEVVDSTPQKDAKPGVTGDASSVDEAVELAAKCRLTITQLVQYCAKTFKKGMSTTKNMQGLLDQLAEEEKESLLGYLRDRAEVS